MKTEKSNIKDLVKIGLRNGKSKEELYYEIKEVYKNNTKMLNEIATIIKYVPEKSRLKKYGIYNTLFLIFLIIVDIANLITLNYGGFIWFGLITYFVAAKLTKYYYWIMLFGVIIFISGIAISIYTGQNVLFLIIGSTIIAAIFIFFGYKMPKLLTPGYYFADETIIDSSGNEITQKRINFS
jgi:hypothetical protein